MMDPSSPLNSSMRWVLTFPLEPKLKDIKEHLNLGVEAVNTGFKGTQSASRSHELLTSLPWATESNHDFGDLGDGHLLQVGQWQV